MKAETFAAEVFVTPRTTTQAYNFGKISGYCGHPRLSHEQFFRHDDWRRPYGRTGMYRAYRKGFEKGRADRLAKQQRDNQPAERDTERER